MKKYKVTSPIRAGGKTHSVGSLVELSDEVAASVADYLEAVPESAPIPTNPIKGTPGAGVDAGLDAGGDEKQPNGDQGSNPDKNPKP